MPGSDPSITIPIVRITHDDGLTLKSALLLGGVNATLRVDPALHAGSDAADHVRIYTPLPYQTGSSVSHWDVSATPNLLMEPALNPDLSSEPDLTLPAFADIGWFHGYLGVGDRPRAIARMGLGEHRAECGRRVAPRHESGRSRMTRTAARAWPQRPKWFSSTMRR